ncbi:hypothetical protein [Clostridioides difficile]|uniref:hypothetical protein n=1 Tax=Clostridioides difficile TaxID=1496 RepID=UPI001F175B40
MVQTIDEYKINLKQGELIFLNQHVIHEIEASNEEDIIINFIINQSFLIILYLCWKMIIQ